MRTIQQIDLLINPLVREVNDINKELMNEDDLSKAKRKSKNARLKKLTNEIVFLRKVIEYIKTSPRESFLRAEVTRLTKVINSKDSQFEVWTKSPIGTRIDVTKQRSYYDNLFHLPLLREKLATAQFILMA